MPVPAGGERGREATVSSSCSGPRRPLWQVRQKYLEVGRRMKDYEDKKYEQWRETTEQILPVLMKKSLLAKVSAPEAGPSTRHRAAGPWERQKGQQGPLSWGGKAADPPTCLVPQFLQA